MALRRSSPGCWESLSRSHYAGVASQTGYLLRLGEVDPAALQDFYQRLRASGMTVDPTVVTFKNWPNVDAFDPKSLPGGEYISQNLLSIWKIPMGGTNVSSRIWSGKTGRRWSRR